MQSRDEPKYHVYKPNYLAVFSRTAGVYIYIGISLNLQIAQNRPYLHTLSPKVGIIYIHGALGYMT